MATKDGATSFEAIIHADRDRKKREELASQILGRSKTSQNVKKNNQKEARSPSLASRMGVQKRSSSTSVPTQRNSFNPPSRPSSTTPSHSYRNGRDRESYSSARTARIANEIDSGNANVSSSRNSSFTQPKQSDGRNGASSQSGPGLSIKGSAGPFTVQLSNFAPGTTELDIEAALQSDTCDNEGNNYLQSCRLTSTRPAVVAEMVISERRIADEIVSKFNNLKADGRLLKVQIIKTGAPRDRERDRERREPRNNGNATAHSDTATANVAPEDIAMSTTEGDMEMDESEGLSGYGTTSYEHEREAADRDRRDRDRNRDTFPGRRDDRREPRDRRDDRDDRTRDRDRDRDREREREHDRERDRGDYDRRENPPASSQPAQQQAPAYDNRPNGPPHQPQYGGGFDRPPRNMGYGYGGTRGYGFSRGGYGGRGGGGGGYRGYGNR